MLVSIITPTHRPLWLAECWESLQKQGDVPFEWVVVLNGASKDVDGKTLFPGSDDPRIRYVSYPETPRGVGPVKRFGFFAAKGDILIELDHDDLLVPGALAKVVEAFEDPEIGFVYSHFADFSDDGKRRTYHDPVVGAAWREDGWRFRDIVIDGDNYVAAVAWEPSALSMSTIHYAPNHIRAWRASVYHAIDGHSADYPICDDLELLHRTYLHTRMHRIDECLYLYRTTGENTWAQSVEKVSHLSGQLYLKNIEALVLREAALLGKPCYDLGGGIDPRPGWIPIDIADVPDAQRANLDAPFPWPWEEGAVGAFRACDFLEHLSDKQHTMNEIHRCLREGGWLLSLTPSSDGRGADMDPTHKSRWNQNAWWYWTRAEQARYIRNRDVRFIDARTETYHPSTWHKENEISYVAADLVALKGSVYEDELPGARRFPRSKKEKE